MVKRISVIGLVLCLLLAVGYAFVKLRKIPQIELPLVFEDYSIIEENGNWYVITEMLPEPTRPISGTFVHNAILAPTFTSLEEMRQTLISGALSESEVDMIQRDHAGKWEICNLNELFDCTLPKNVSIQYCGPSGAACFWLLKSDIFSSGSIRWLPKEQYDENYSKDYLRVGKNAYSAENISDRNATEYLCNTGNFKYKYLKYQIESQGKTIYVVEEYLLASNSQIDRISESIPNRITLFIEENGAFAYAKLYDLEDRPSVKWLSAFGLVAYTA